MIRFRVPYPVSVNRAWRSWRGRPTLSTEGRAYKERCALLASVAMVDQDAGVLRGDVRLHYTLHPRLTKAGRASKTRVDVGNVDKLLSDALNGVVWLDDKQVVDFRVTVGEPLPDGGVTVEVAAA